MARRLSLIFGMGFFRGGGVNFCAGIFCVLLETQRIFFQGGKVDFCPHSSISVT